MKKVITLTKECNDIKIEEFIKSQILPNIKRYETVEFSLEKREDAIIDKNTTKVISKKITLNQIKNKKFRKIYFENCLICKARVSETPLDKSPLIQINANLKNCLFINCSIGDLNTMNLENCTFINCEFLRQYDVNFNGSMFKNCRFIKVNNEETSRNLNFSNCSFEKCLIDRVFGCKFDNVDFTEHGAIGLLYNYNEKVNYPGVKNAERFPLGYSSILLPAPYTNSYKNYSFKGAKISKNDLLVMSQLWATNGLGFKIKYQTNSGEIIPVTTNEIPLPLMGPLTQGLFTVTEIGQDGHFPIIEFKLKGKNRNFEVVDTVKQDIKFSKYENKSINT